MGLSEFGGRIQLEEDEARETRSGLKDFKTPQMSNRDKFEELAAELRARRHERLYQYSDCREGVDAKSEISNEGMPSLAKQLAREKELISFFFSRNDLNQDKKFMDIIFDLDDKISELSLTPLFAYRMILQEMNKRASQKIFSPILHAAIAGTCHGLMLSK